MGSELIGPGLQLLIAGMGTVFVLLGLLVTTCALLSRTVRGWHATRAVEADDEDEIVAAVTAAIRHHRLRVAGGSRVAGGLRTAGGS